MEREPFPKPGERLVDSARAPEATGQPSGPPTISLRGSFGYGPRNPSWWVGRGGYGFSRLTVENDSILVQPDRLSRVLFRLPVVRIPLDNIASASTTPWGIWFHIPGDATLDGTRFTRLGGDCATLVELLEARGVPVEAMSFRTRVKKSF